MEYRRAAVAIATVLALAGCAPTPSEPKPSESKPETSAPATQETSPAAEESPAAETSPSEEEKPESSAPAQNDTKPVDGVKGDVMKRGVSAAQGAGYSCKAVSPGDKIIVQRVDCEQSGTKLTIVEYVSPRERGPHIKTWAPTPKRPVGDKWLLAGDQPRDFDRVAEQMMSGYRG